MGESVAGALVLLVGPQAAGKSTIAAALAEALRRDGESVALVELDQVAAMALPTLPSWSVAHRIFAMVAGAWARTSLTCVIAEGSGSAAEVAEVWEEVPDGVPRVTVAVSTSLEMAYARAQLDPTRGASQDYDFLSVVYGTWSNELLQIGADAVVDTTECPLDEAIATVCAAIRRARGKAGNHQRSWS